MESKSSASSTTTRAEPAVDASVIEAQQRAEDERAAKQKAAELARQEALAKKQAERRAKEALKAEKAALQADRAALKEKVNNNYACVCRVFETDDNIQERLLKQMEKQERKAAKLEEQQAALERKRQEREEKERVAQLPRCRACVGAIDPASDAVCLGDTGTFHRTTCATCPDCHR